MLQFNSHMNIYLHLNMQKRPHHETLLFFQLKDIGTFALIAVITVVGVGVYYHANIWPDHQTMLSGDVANWRIWFILLYPYWQLYGELDIESIDGKIVNITTTDFVYCIYTLHSKTNKLIIFFYNFKASFYKNLLSSFTLNLIGISTVEYWNRC